MEVTEWQNQDFFPKKNIMTYDTDITSHHTVYFRQLGPYKQRETDRQTEYIKYIKTEIHRIHT